MTVFCLVELDSGAVAEASLRALTLARDLAAGTGVTAVAFAAGPAVADLGPELAAYGAGDVYAVSGLGGYAPQAWARALAELAGARRALDTGDRRSAKSSIDLAHTIVEGGSAR